MEQPDAARPQRMDLLGDVLQEAGDETGSCAENRHRTQGRQEKTLLLDRLHPPQGQGDQPLDQRHPEPEEEEMTTSTEIIGIGRVTFHPGKAEEYKRLSKQCMEIVKAKDRGTLQYDVFIN